MSKDIGKQLASSKLEDPENSENSENPVCPGAPMVTQRKNFTGGSLARREPQVVELPAAAARPRTPTATSPIDFTLLGGRHQRTAGGAKPQAKPAAKGAFVAHKPKVS
jgi:hypothetical protein